jgi:homogentisate 1,2-dioxygenase
MAAAGQRVLAELEVRERARKTASSLRYSTGFGNEHSSEAIPGALPVGRNNPRKAPHGLYTELVSETGFTELRANTRRTWLYRVRPSVASPRFERIDNGTYLTPPFRDVPLEPNALFWTPRPAPAPGTDFVAGLWTLGGNGSPTERNGVAVHLYTANSSMTDRVFSSTDGEMLIAPEKGALLLHTELGRLSVQPGAIALIPRAHKFRVEIQDTGDRGPDFVRGYVFENFGRSFMLPELGFIGQSGMANPRDFHAPTAAYDEESLDRPVEVIHKLGGNLWRAEYGHSPLDVVAWHGTSVPYVYDLSHFMVMGSVSFDHPDPSRYTVLTSPTAIPGAGNIDFRVAVPEWFISDDTMWPPYFHRNISAEFAGVIKEPAHADGFVEGAAALNNMLVPHGVEASMWDSGEKGEPTPFKTDQIVLLVETYLPIALTGQAAATTATSTNEQLSGNNTSTRRFRA